MPDSPKTTAEVAHAIATGMPKCPVCGGRNVRRSEPVGLEDKIRGMFHQSPFRCRSCQHRFYGRVAAVADPLPQ
jgi:transposase-like protein